MVAETMAHIDHQAPHKVVAIISSPLQLSVFKASSVSQDANVTMIGCRGVRGDITYDHSVMNHTGFIADLDKLIGDATAEVFLPHSLGLLYFVCVADERIATISYVDEGELTKRYLEGGFRKPQAWYHGLFVVGSRSALRLPKTLRPYGLRVLVALIQRLVGRRYSADTINYPYRTINRSVKPGRLLSHLPVSDDLDDVEVVDLTRHLDLPRNYKGRACLFIHPNELKDLRWLERLCVLLKDSPEPLLIRLHPLFKQFPDIYAEMYRQLHRQGIDTEEAVLSGEHDTAIELRARGVDLFLCGNSSIRATVEGYPAFFEGLRCINIIRGESEKTPS